MWRAGVPSGSRARCLPKAVKRKIEGNFRRLNFFARPLSIPGSSMMEHSVPSRHRCLASSLARAPANHGPVDRQVTLRRRRRNRGSRRRHTLEAIPELRGINEDIVVAFIVAPPGTTVATDERRHLANKPVWRRSRRPSDECPFIGDRDNGRRVASGSAHSRSQMSSARTPPGRRALEIALESTPDG